MAKKHTIDREEGIIHLTFTGESTIDEVKTAILDISNDPNYKPQYHILTDLRTCVLAFAPDALIELSHIFKERYSSSSGKSAFLIDSPHEAVIAMLYKKEVKEMRLVEVFSTPEAALTWLKGD